MTHQTQRTVPVEGYGGEDRPLSAYLTLIGLFHAIFALFLLVTRASDRRIPQRVSPGDVLLFGVATQKLTYLLANDAVTSVIRAPFVEFQEMESPSNVEETPRGSGLRRAIGELLKCKFCLGQWVASFFAYGLVLSPAVTRLVGSVFAMVALSDFLHQAYDALKNRA